MCLLTGSNILVLSRVACGMNRFLFDERKDGLQGAGRAIHYLSYSNLILTCPRCNLLSHTAQCTLRDGGINFSSILEEMPDKTGNSTTRPTCRKTSDRSWGNFELLQVSSTTAGKV
jgi:hypothetical protein